MVINVVSEIEYILMRKLTVEEKNKVKECTQTGLMNPYDVAGKLQLKNKYGH